MVVLEPDLRRDIVAAGQKLAEKGFVTSTHGSLSARLDNDLVLCSPAGVPKEELTRTSAVKISLSGERVFGGGQPTSFLPVHKVLYAITPAAAVVHAQPPQVQAALENVHSALANGESAQSKLGASSILVLSAASAEQAAQVVEHDLGAAEAAYISDYGLVVWGQNLAAAMAQLESLEAAASTSRPFSATRQSIASSDELVARLSQRITEAMAQDSTPLAAGSSEIPNADDAEEETGCGSSIEGCNNCGRCTASGGSLPSAQQEAALDALSHLSDAQLVAIIAEATREVLAEKGLL